MGGKKRGTLLVVFLVLALASVSASAQDMQYADMRSLDLLYATSVSFSEHRLSPDSWLRDWSSSELQATYAMVQVSYASSSDDSFIHYLKLSDGRHQQRFITTSIEPMYDQSGNLLGAVSEFRQDDDFEKTHANKAYTYVEFGQDGRLMTFWLHLTNQESDLEKQSTIEKLITGSVSANYFVQPDTHTQFGSSKHVAGSVKPHEESDQEQDVAAQQDQSQRAQCTVVGPHNRLQKGVITYLDGENQEKRLHDYCVNDATLVEHECILGEAQEVHVTCPQGCSDGRCVEALPQQDAVELCEDHDGGQAHDTFSEVSGVTSSGRVYLYEDHCEDDTSLVEFYCDSNTFAQQRVACEHGCFGGRCRETTQSESCIDSDGNDHRTKGSVNGVDIFGKPYVKTDSCEGEEGKLLEYVCDGTILHIEEHSCEQGCQGGVCV